MNEDRGNPSGSDNLGYGRPPVGSRFKKGKSGNPKGRPKAEPKNDVQMLHEILNEEISIKIAGKVEKVPAKMAIMRMMIRDGLSGTARDRLAVYRAMSKIRLFSLDADYERVMRENHTHVMALHTEVNEMLRESHLMTMVGIGVKLNARQQAEYDELMRKIAKQAEDEDVANEGEDDDFDTSPDPDDD